MQLVTFGRVRLSSCDFSRPKPLLLLSYVTLAGPQERRKLADLFWTGANQAKNDVSKKLGKLSVVLTQFKREGAPVFPDTPGLDPLPSLVTCDALDFLAALEKNDLPKALELYQGPFLHDFGKPLDDLEVSEEILEWVLEKREFFGEKARSAMLQLSEEAHEAGKEKEATQWAEKAYSLSEAPEMEPAQLSRLQYLLGVKSEVKKKVAKAVQASLDEVSSEAREVFLALSLQTSPHLSVIREALKLSIDALSQAREELLLSGLVDAESRVLAKDMAKDWLTGHPAERVPLLMKLARATPAHEAFDFYHSIYQETKGFGGIGDLQKARKAYQHTAQRFMDAREFTATIETLSELREVEVLYEAEPEAQCVFLEAYALERLGRFKEAFELLQTLSEDLHNPNITALKSVVLWRLGKSDEARTAAESALKSGLEWMWAKATANNTLGYLAYSSEELLEAASFFKKAASLFHTAGEKDRWVGSLNNYANTLALMIDVAQRNSRDTSVVERAIHDAEAAYLAALEALDPLDENNAQRVRILFNLGTVWESAKAWEKAEKYYLQALPFAEKTGDLETTARLHITMGTVYSEHQKNDKRAKESYMQAIQAAAKAGEYAMQGLAAAYLAKMEKDPDSLEIALELLEQSGQQQQYPFFEDDYEVILKLRLEETLTGNDVRKAYHLFSKLGELYQKQQKEKKVAKIADALNALAQTTKLSEHKDVLLALINGQTSYPATLPN
jgi:tetratricopeptide (TPR) repeat protein